MLRQEDLAEELNRNIKSVQQAGECQDFPLPSAESVSRWIHDGKLPDKQLYSPGEILPLMMNLWLKENKQIVKIGQNRQSSIKWKTWATSNWKRVEQKEDLLWSRPKYQKDLNEMAEKWNIPKDGFAGDKAEEIYINKLRGDQNRWDIFKAEIEQIVKRHSKSRLQLGDAWAWVVERHLLSRDKGRLAAKLMVNMMSLPQIEIKEDRWGRPLAVRLIIEQGTPEEVIRELKKDVKVLEEELGIKARGRENVSPKRERAKKLYDKSPSEIAQASDIKLRQRYKKIIEG